MSGSVLDEIRVACEAVAARARFVRIDRARLEDFARGLPSESGWVRGSELTYAGNEADAAAFVVTLDAINFGSGWWPHIRKLPGLSGYFTMATHLKTAYEERGPLAPEALVGLTGSDCARLFRQDDDGLPGELMEHYATALGDLGRLVLQRFDGRFESLVLAANGSAERLLGILAALPYYRDIARYGQLDVPLFKRAQLTAADLATALPDSRLGRFTDLDRLTIFADNLVPHVLRVEGVLSYDAELAARIDRDEPLEAGSVEEVEIRAVGLHAVELLVAELAAQGHETTSMALDYLLWDRGQQPEFKAVPRHRARSVFY